MHYISYPDSELFENSHCILKQTGQDRYPVKTLFKLFNKGMDQLDQEEVWKLFCMLNMRMLFNLADILL